MSPFLTDVEVAEITDPLTQAAARHRFFKREFGITARKKPNGQPLVLRSEFDAAKARPRRQKSPAPDWKKLEAMGKPRLSVV